jgi:small subunit ribosomal protein S15
MAGSTEIKEKVAGIVAKFGKTASDTGSPETQIALLSNRIVELTQHFKDHPKDHASRTGLFKMVGQRRRLLNYLKLRDEKRYALIVNKLELRK